MAGAALGPDRRPKQGSQVRRRHGTQLQLLLQHRLLCAAMDCISVGILPHPGQRTHLLLALESLSGAFAAGEPKGSRIRSQLRRRHVCPRAYVPQRRPQERRCPERADLLFDQPAPPDTERLQRWHLEQPRKCGPQPHVFNRYRLCGGRPLLPQGGRERDNQASNGQGGHSPFHLGHPQLFLQGAAQGQEKRTIHHLGQRHRLLVRAQGL